MDPGIVSGITIASRQPGGGVGGDGTMGRVPGGSGIIGLPRPRTDTGAHLTRPRSSSSDSWSSCTASIGLEAGTTA
jgi:hypothetical protein